MQYIWFILYVATLVLMIYGSYLYGRSSIRREFTTALNKSLKAGPGHKAQYLIPIDANTGVARIAAERSRHEKACGWTAEHDDEHTKGELNYAAIVYAGYARPELQDNAFIDDIWPWPQTPPETEGEIRNLEIAGSLIAAEIDRLLRKQIKDYEEYKDPSVHRSLLDISKIRDMDHENSTPLVPLTIAGAKIGDDPKTLDSCRRRDPLFAAAYPEGIETMGTPDGNGVLYIHAPGYDNRTPEMVAKYGNTVLNSINDPLLPQRELGPEDFRGDDYLPPDHAL